MKEGEGRLGVARPRSVTRAERTGLHPTEQGVVTLFPLLFYLTGRGRHLEEKKKLTKRAVAPA